MGVGRANSSSWQSCALTYIYNHTERQAAAKPNLAVLTEYRRREKEFLQRALDLERITVARDAAKALCDRLRKERLEGFMAGFGLISMKLKEMYQVCLPSVYA